MKRREFIGLGGAALFTGAAARLTAQTQATSLSQMSGPNAVAGKTGDDKPADFTLRIAPVALEIAPSRFISTIGYNGACPGPVRPHA